MKQRYTFPLTLSILGKILADDTMILISYFPQKIGFDLGDNLHELPKPMFWEK